MWPYWLLFLVPAVAAVVTPSRRGLPSATAVREPIGASWVIAGVAIAVMIGCRYEVGADWEQYLHILDQVTGATLSEVLQMGDPGYELINWIAANMELGVVSVNLIGGALFSAGLVCFCISLPRPWLALAIAVPYVVIVVAMGYSRQGIALGLAMLGLQALQQGRTFRFVLWVLLGATFHKTAILLLPIVALANSRNRYWTIVWVGVVSVVAYAVLLRDAVDTLYANYVEAEYQSEGALTRLLMNALPAVLLLWKQRRFSFTQGELSVWRWFAMISLLLLVVLFGTSATTAVDRLALYMLPLQMVVFSHLPSVLSKRDRQTGWVFLVLLYYAVVLFVWLNFATHSQFWLPYHFYPLQTL